LSLVDMTLRDSPDLVIHIWLRYGLFGGHRVGEKSLAFSWRSSLTVARARCARALSYWNTVIIRHSAYCWQQFLSQKHITIVCSVIYAPGSTKK